jgi:hypothetical protein
MSSAALWGKPKKRPERSTPIGTLKRHMELTKCPQCEKQAQKWITVELFGREEFVYVCSSRCLLTYALQSYLQWSDSQLGDVRKLLHDSEVAVETAMSPGSPRDSIMSKLRQARIPLSLIDRRR